MTDDQIRYLTIVLEDVQKSVGVIAEGHGLVHEKLDRVDIRLDRVETELTYMRGDVDGLLTKVAQHDARFSHIDAKLDELIATVNGTTRPRK